MRWILVPCAIAAVLLAAPSSSALAQVRSDAPRIAISATIVVETASRVPLQIGIEPLAAAPRQSLVRLTGLPPLVSLSGGYAISPGAWAVPLAMLSDLHLTVPAGHSGQSELTISLVAADGEILARASTTLIISAKPVAAPERSTTRDALLLTPADRDNAEKMIARGERDLRDGNVALARQFFLRAAEAGLARGALLLGGTYDARELERQGARGVQANPALARKWYERARELGAPEAEERLSRLGGS